MQHDGKGNILEKLTSQEYIESGLEEQEIQDMRENVIGYCENPAMH